MVPEGGVKEGEKICVPLPEGWAAIRTVAAPVGRWKDGLFDCFKHGVCHPLLWNAWCCPSIATGQVLQRLRLNWLGNEGTAAQTKNTFRNLLWMTISYYSVREIMSYSFAYLTTESSKQAMLYAFDALNLLFGVFVLYLVAKTRSKVRARYDIPTENCGACEDVCCSFWCSCCTVAQISRHTADYENYPALCCSETGLAPNAPAAAYAAGGPSTSEYHAPSVGVV
mmetsp:Transcript_2443/g.3099  ORF Transcript_2443/g.3099 Transcript_2443/m.3099 type:complete len:225 (+) Transcript_2443:76-750(+)